MKRLRSIARKCLNGIHGFLQVQASRNRLAAAIYYSIFNHQLSREAMAVAAGQTRYHADKRRAEGNLYLLRRSIHRLEKGLIMRPRRASFGADYIGDAVRMYAAAAGTWSEEIAWAGDVLEAYFSSVASDDPRIEDAHIRFKAVARRPADDVGSRSPYKRSRATELSVDFESFARLCKRRRSVRWYTDARVPREMIDKALACATLAPSACNRQPFVFRVFDEPEAAQRVTSIPMGTRGFCHQVPAVAVLVGQLRAYPFERDRHAIYIDGALAAMAFMLALETLGLASCPINWPDQEPHESLMRNALSLEPDERVIMLISFGYPDPEGGVPFSAKRSLDLVRTFNR